MKIQDLDFAVNRKIIATVEKDIGLKVNSIIDISPMPIESNDTYLINKKDKITISPQDSNYLHFLLEHKKQDKKYPFFVIDYIDGNKLYITTYLVRKWNTFTTPINIKCSHELLKGTTVEKLKEKYLCSDFKKPTIFAITSYEESQKDIKEIKFISEKNFLLVEDINGVWLAKKESKNEHNIRSYNTVIIAISATDICFVEDEQSKNFAEKIDMFKKEFKESKTFTDLWDSYWKIEQEIAKEKERKFGNIKYNSYTKNHNQGRGVEITFNLESDFSYEDQSGRFSLVVWDGVSQDDNRKLSIPVGIYRKSGNKTITTSLEEGDVDIPGTGVLFLDTTGSESIDKRRKNAKNILEREMTPIAALRDIINGNSTGLPLSKQYDAITGTFLKNHPEAKSFNDSQKKALKIAINTPDIAVIQGPPGTGKTTVIRAIIKRFEEIFAVAERKKQEKYPNYEMASPVIVISGFDNTAVDNAIEIKDGSGFPAYRIISKTKSSKNYIDNRKEWLNKCIERLENSLKNETYVQYNEKLEELNARYKSFCSQPNNLSEGQNIVQEYLTNFKNYIPSGLALQAKKLIETKAQSPIAEQNIVEEELSFPGLLKMQFCETIGQFRDGGLPRAQKLYLYLLRAQTETTDEIKELKNILSKICTININSAEFEELFKDYSRITIALRDEFCTNSQSGRNITEEIKAIIKTLEKEIKILLQERPLGNDDLETIKTFIVAQYLNRFRTEYKQLIKKYSYIIGATCQKTGSYDLYDKEFDLLIVDEGTKATPLDLFIPLVKAKKIILVGDQKQLSHWAMLDQETLNKLQDVDIQKERLKTSLFEKLFDSLESAGKSVRLTEQFRYNETICNFVSEHFYDGTLKTGKIEDTSSVRPDSGLYQNKELVAIDIPLSKGKEVKRNSSRIRECEAEQIIHDLKKIIHNQPNSKIGVITFYSEQKALLINKLDGIFDEKKKEHIFIDTVDAFQGQEKDYILLSAVRANDKHQVGFLNITNRLCVAFSRAHKQLIVYGDKNTIAGGDNAIDSFKSLYKKYEQEADND